MQLLKDILYKAGTTEVIGDLSSSISQITFDSENVMAGSLFIAVKGTRNDGHNYINKAVESGAKAIVCEIFPENINNNTTYVKVKNSSEALGWIASNFYNNPSQKLKLVGITGTNGKTTIATLLHQLFRKLDYKAGLLSTVCNKINDTIIPSTHTTPDAIQLNALLKMMVDAGCTHCFMEVSSHAVVQNRITGLDFTGGVFSNITHDHLDYHKTFAEYLSAKKHFFDSLSSRAFAVTNADDNNGYVMLQNTKALRATYSLKNPAEYKAKILENVFSGLQMNVDGVDVWFKLVGSFNAYNILAIYSTSILLGEDRSEILKILSGLEAVEGRFDCIRSEKGIVAIIDYAHTPDALNNVLNTINAVKEGYEKVITVVGCGGDRDKTKRPLMAKIACDNCNRVILTSDNPRSEDPEKIIEEMMVGVDVISKKKVLSIINRQEAIKTALMFAQKEDIVLIAGKGHEKYQDIKGVKHPFDDKQIVKEIFEQL
ncbi:MAG: UDP-N-acetylmuramoyl-L-alanyl-D-glutamate--2,6-diaminopimelate ligase [Bacteroidetes bacterium]|nr:UDP-N-acetylmuramoyl-L-alanyl-D-glutamate--2,6-diaminopimelate ligase [Bacteroidota bacterium]